MEKPLLEFPRLDRLGMVEKMNSLIFIFGNLMTCETVGIGYAALAVTFVIIFREHRGIPAKLQIPLHRGQLVLRMIVFSWDTVFIWFRFVQGYLRSLHAHFHKVDFLKGSFDRAENRGKGLAVRVPVALNNHLADADNFKSKPLAQDLKAELFAARHDIFVHDFPKVVLSSVLVLVDNFGKRADATLKAFYRFLCGGPGLLFLQFLGHIGFRSLEVRRQISVGHYLFSSIAHKREV